jgi:hypothetical protein
MKINLFFPCSPKIYAFNFFAIIKIFIAGFDELQVLNCNAKSYG